MKILIILMVVIFGLKMLSEILFEKSIKNGKIDMDTMSLSSKFFPIVSETYFRHGYELLSEFSTSKKDSLLTKSRISFIRSIKLNNLNFYSYFFLGKSYLLSESTDPVLFEKGLKYLKFASAIRKTAVKVNIDTIKIYLSLWPFLDKEAKDSAINLMRSSAFRMGKHQFANIIEVWGLYSKDGDFLKSIINKDSKYYEFVIDVLKKQELEMELRQSLISDLELSEFKKIEKEFRKSSGSLEELQNNLDLFDDKIKWYYNIVPESKLNEQKVNKLKKEIYIKLFTSIFMKSGIERNEKIKVLSEKYLEELNLIQDVEALKIVLEQKHFFDSQSLGVFYLKQKVNYKTGQITKMINEIEGFRQSVTFVKEGQEKDLAKLLTLLVDGYLNSRLLTKAVDILKEIEKITPGLMSTYWRLMKIESVIGEDDFFADIKEEYFEKINNSSNILINNKNIKTPVFPYKNDKIVLILDEAYSEKFREFHLLQVFLNGRIFHESYIEELKFPIELSLPEEFKKVKFEVEINLVQ